MNSFLRSIHYLQEAQIRQKLDSFENSMSLEIFSFLYLKIWTIKLAVCHNYDIIRNDALLPMEDF